MMLHRLFPQVALPFLLVGLLDEASNAQNALKVEGKSFDGVLHDNVSNEKRQGSGFTPLVHKAHPKASLFRDDAVGMNFEHIFNGAKAEHGISMFTPRRDPCEVRRVRDGQYELVWPSQGSKWGMEARMLYDLSKPNRVDLTFSCKPTVDRFSQGYAAMMWASYMHHARDRRIYFWGRDGDSKGWVAFGEGTPTDFEVGTVAHASATDLPFEKDAQILNVREHPAKKFETPFITGFSTVITI